MQLFEAVINTAWIVDNPRMGTSNNTGGLDTVLTDSTVTTRAGWFTNGTLIITTPNNSGSYGKLNHIYNNDPATEFDLGSQPIYIPTNSEYVVLRSTYSAQDYIHAINMALQEIGNVPWTYDLWTVEADKVEYDLLALAHNVTRVETTLQTSAPYEWTVNYHWAERNGTLFFDKGYEPVTVGAPIRIHYNAPHAILTDGAEYISQEINAQRLAWHAAFLLAQKRLSLEPDAQLKEFLGLASAQKAMLQMRYPVRQPIPDPHFATY